MADEILSLLEALADAGTPCVLATVVRCSPPTSARPGDKAVITADGGLTGWIGGSCSEPLVRREALRALADGQPRLVSIVGSDAAGGLGEVQVATTCPSGGSLDVFIEPRLPRPLLVVAGGGPAAAALTGMGDLAGFRVVEWEAGSVIEVGEDSAAVVVSMGHYDEDALEALLRAAFADVVLVASARRFGAVLEALRARGVGAAALARVRAAGRRVRGATQAEIAALVLADVVAARRERLAEAAVGAGFEAAFATDPVCGMTVDLPARIGLLHEGRAYAFCCEGCRAAFEAAPEMYTAVRN